MKALVFVLVLLLAGIVGLGFYRGWFRLSMQSMDNQPSATITVDKVKIQEDEKSAKEKVQSFGQEAKETAGELADKVQGQERRR